jgi:hypothetical protein
VILFHEHAGVAKHLAEGLSICRNRRRGHLRKRPRIKSKVNSQMVREIVKQKMRYADNGGRLPPPPAPQYTLKGFGRPQHKAAVKVGR